MNAGARRARVVVPSHIFHDLAPERAVLEPRGIEVVDGSALDPEMCRAAVRDADALLCQYSWPTRRSSRRSATAGSSAPTAPATTRSTSAPPRPWHQGRPRPDYGVDEVSDHAMALMLASARGLGVLAGDPPGRVGLPATGPLHRLRGRPSGSSGSGGSGGASGQGARLRAPDPGHDPTWVPRCSPSTRRSRAASSASSPVGPGHGPRAPARETRGLLDRPPSAHEARRLPDQRGPGSIVDERALSTPWRPGTSPARGSTSSRWSRPPPTIPCSAIRG